MSIKIVCGPIRLHVRAQTAIRGVEISMSIHLGTRSLTLVSLKSVGSVS